MQLESLRKKQDYYAEGPTWVRNFWKKPTSFSFFLKENRTTLEELGAIVRPGREYFINIDEFPHAARIILKVPEERKAA
jgi:hypothetical protein